MAVSVEQEHILLVPLVLTAVGRNSGETFTKHSQGRGVVQDKRFQSRQGWGGQLEEDLVAAVCQIGVGGEGWGGKFTKTGAETAFCDGAGRVPRTGYAAG